MRIYLAAPYQMREAAKAFALVLAGVGVGCTSRWVFDDGAAAINDDWARKDLTDVRRADALVALNPAEWAQTGTGGRHVEFGYAVALQKPILVVGVRTNIFHHLSDVMVVLNESEAPEALRTMARLHDFEAVA